MQMRDAAVDEVDHLLGAYRRGDEAAGRRIVFETLEALGEPGGHARAGAAGEIGGLLEILHRHDARHDRDFDPRRGGDVEKAEIDGIVEEELGDRAVGAGVDLALQRLDVVQQGRALRVLFGIGGDRDLEIAGALDRGDEIFGALVAFGVRGIGRIEPARQNRRAARRCGARPRRDSRDDAVDLGTSRRRRRSGARPARRSVSRAMRATVAWVRARVEPPAP